MYPQFHETKTELQLHQQKSLKSVLIASTDSSGTGVQSTETSAIKLLLCDTINIIVVLTTGNSQIEEIDAAKSTDRESAQATDLGTYYVAT